MGIRPERRIEALDHRHRAGLHRADHAFPPRAPPQPRRDRANELAQHRAGQHGIEHHPRAQRVGQGQDPLSNGHVRDDAIHEPGREVAHAASYAARTETTTAARERDGAAPPAVATLGQDQTLRKNPAAQEGLHFGHDERGEHRRLGHRLQLTDERLPVRLQRRIEDGFFWPVPLVAGGRERRRSASHRAWPPRFIGSGSAEVSSSATAPRRQAVPFEDEDLGTLGQALGDDLGVERIGEDLRPVLEGRLVVIRLGATVVVALGDDLKGELA